MFIEFSNYAHGTSISSILSKVGSVDIYYREVSYGALWLNISYLNFWITLNNTREYYGADSSNQVDVNWLDYVYDSLGAADPYIDYNNYDYVFLVHAGYDQASSGDPNDLWSRASINKWFFSFDGGVYLGFSIVAEYDPYGVFAHELAHNLGFPDLYDYSYQEEFVGKWSLMDYGSWLNPPSSFLSVEKIWVGWIPLTNYTVVQRDQEMYVSLKPLETPGGTLAIKIPLGSIYYTVEYRRKILTDSALPGSGVIISRVDESLSNGIVKVVDRVASTWSKDDAMFLAGDVYKNLNDDFYVKVLEVTPSHALVFVKNGIPNLIVNSINWSGSIGNVDITVNIWNSGGPVSNFTVDLYVDGIHMGSKLVASTLGRSSGVSIVFQGISLGAGNHSVLAIVDQADNIIERNESDNQLSSYIFLEPVYILDRYVASDDRADVGSVQKLWIHFMYYSNSSDYAGKQVYINGTGYVTNASGWVEITVSSNSVGSLRYILTDLNGYQNATPVVIFDRVVVNIAVLDDRVDVGTQAPINIEAYYEYDWSPFYGEVVLNDTLQKDVVGKYWYTTAYILDYKYNLSVFNSNVVYVIYDRVVVSDIVVLDTRVNVGSGSIPMNISAYYEYDGAYFQGELIFNDTIPKYTVGKYWYRVEGIRDDLYGLTSFISNTTFYIIYDKVIISLSVSDGRIGVGEAANIAVEAYYAYDDSPFDGEVVLNDTLVHDAVGKYWYTVSWIANDRYGITIFESNSVYVIFDRINVTLTVADTRINIGEGADLTWSAVYEYDGQPFNGTIYLNRGPIQTNVGMYDFYVVGVVDELYGIDSFTSNTVYVIFDAVNITLYVEDTRIDVGSTANISIEAVYAYDGTPYGGTVLLNDSLTKYEVGGYWYGVVVYGDDPYGISVALYEPVLVIFDRIRVEVSVDNRVNIGEDALEAINAYYEYDGEPLVGSIVLNDTTVKYVVGRYTFEVIGVYDAKYGLTVYVAEPVVVIFDKVIINLYPLRERYDVGREALIGIDARYAYDGAPFDGIVVLNDSLVKYEPGVYGYEVLYIANDSYGITVYEANKVSLVFDMVVINLEVLDDRVGVGEAANITFSAYYMLDGEPFVGEIFLNDSLVKDVVGKYCYTVAGIRDGLYGLTSFKSNYVCVIFDKVNITLYVDDDRIDVGSNASIHIEAYYMYDGEPYQGQVVLNDTTTKFTVGKYFYTVSRIYGDKYGVEAFTSNIVAVVFDRVVIKLSTEYNRVPVGSYVNITIEAYYEYDGRPFRGEVILNDTLVHYEIGLYNYSVLEIRDDEFGLSSFTSNSIQVIFDRPELHVEIRAIIPLVFDVNVGVFSPFNGSYIPSSVEINGEALASTGYNGIYSYRIIEPLPIKKFIVKAEAGPFNFERSYTEVNISTIILYTALLIVSILLVIWVGSLRRR